MPDSIDNAINGVVPGKINCLYWRDSVSNYLGDAGTDARIDLWGQVLTDYFDPKVKAGVLVWANFGEVSEHLDWEQNHRRGSSLRSRF